MGGNYRLGRMLGIPIELNPSWFLILALVVWSLAAEVFPVWQPGLSAPVYWLAALVSALVLFGSLLLHEMAHSLVSRRYGIEVKRITLFLFGGVSESPEEMPSPKAEFWIAIVGPLTSFALAGLYFALGWVVERAGGPVAASSALGWLGVINAGLALFNLVPGFPLDGGRVLRAAVWAATHDLRKATRWASYGGKAFAMVLIGIGVSRLLAGNWFGGLWLGFLGWLLFQAAQGSYTQLKLKQALGTVPVGQLMSRDVEVLPPEATLREAVEQHFMRHGYGGYPVVDADGRLRGLLTRAQVKAVPADQWDAVTAEAAMVPVERMPVLAPGEAVGDRLETLLGEGLGRLPVVEDGRLVGLLSGSDVIRYLSWYGDEDAPDLLR